MSLQCIIIDEEAVVAILGVGLVLEDPHEGVPFGDVGMMGIADKVVIIFSFEVKLSLERGHLNNSLELGVDTLPEE